MADSHLTAAQKAASLMIRESALAVVVEACGTDVSDTEVDWEATTFSRHELPDFQRLEERQCATFMAGYIAEHLYLGQPWQLDEARLRHLVNRPEPSQKSPQATDDALKALLVIRTYHPDLSEDQLLASYRQHEQNTHDWLQKIEVWTAVLKKARALGLREDTG